MAEGYIQNLRPDWKIFSGGINPSGHVHAKAVQVMQEVGIDISHNKPENVDQFLGQAFDYAITVCDNARETCLIFSGQVGQQLHIGFDDLAEVTGPEEFVLSEFRRIRNKISRAFTAFVADISKA